MLAEVCRQIQPKSKGLGAEPPALKTNPRPRLSRYGHSKFRLRPFLGRCPAGDQTAPKLPLGISQTYARARSTSLDPDLHIRIAWSHYGLCAG
jgi:hypothetical protein